MLKTDSVAPAEPSSVQPKPSDASTGTSASSTHTGQLAQQDLSFLCVPLVTSPPPETGSVRTEPSGGPVTVSLQPDVTRRFDSLLCLLFKVASVTRLFVPAGSCVTSEPPADPEAVCPPFTVLGRFRFCRFCSQTGFVC